MVNNSDPNSMPEEFFIQQEWYCCGCGARVRVADHSFRWNRPRRCWEHMHALSYGQSKAYPVTAEKPVWEMRE